MFYARDTAQQLLTIINYLQNFVEVKCNGCGDGGSGGGGG